MTGADITAGGPWPSLTQTRIRRLPDLIWPSILAEAAALETREPLLADMLRHRILGQPAFEDALANLIAGALMDVDLEQGRLTRLLASAFWADAQIGKSARADLLAIRDRDPACTSYLAPFLYFKGFLALQAYRVAHWLWEQGAFDIALLLQSRSSRALAVDIHPAARIGRGILLDHATGIVIGETAVVEDDVSIMQGVTLGGTGKERGDRHPKVRCRAFIGAATSILGNIEIGHDARIGAGSIVLHDIPPEATAVGVPAAIVGSARYLASRQSAGTA